MAGFAHPLSQDWSNKLHEGYRVSTIGGFTLAQGQDEEKDAYVVATAHLLNQEILNGRLQPGDQNRVKMIFSFERHIARYKHPVTGKMEHIDLFSLEGEAKEAIEEYLKAAKAKTFSSSSTCLLRSNSKGNEIGEPALKRNTLHLRSLPNGDTHVYETLMPTYLRKLSTRDERIHIATRLHFVEFMRRKMLQSLEKDIDLKDKQIIALAQNLRAQPANQQEIAVLRKEVNRLREVREEVERVDYHALAHLLALYPCNGQQPVPITPETLKPMLEGKLAQVDGAYREEMRKSPPDQKKGKELQKEIEHLHFLVQNVEHLDIYEIANSLSKYPLDDFWFQDLAPIRQLIHTLIQDVRGQIQAHKGIFQKGKEFFGLEKEKLSNEEIEYIKDLVGMLYTSRWEYQSYCRQNHLKMKKEGMADLLLREAVRYAQDEDVYDGRGFATSKWSDAFDVQFFPDMSNLSTWEIGEIEAEWYHMPPGPALGLPEGAQKALDEQRDEELRAHLKAQRDRMHWDSTVADIPSPPPPPPAPGLLSRTWNWLWGS